MSKIFLSHSSLDNGPAIAIAEWLQQNGWDEYFLDVKPERGIAAGERWERKLYQAATRCEAVLFLISRNWLASPWCLREMELAYKLNKHLFAVLIDDTPRSEVPKTISPWQIANLNHGQDHILIEVKLPDQRLAQVTFSHSGLATLSEGLRRAQIDPVHFPWPPEDEPDRAPWRGLEPLELKDAGIFFGRDGQIIGALDRIRALREAAPPRLMPIIGASGAGKSSFLRAGLIPRLKRDDHNYLVLPVIRPEGGALKALTASLCETALKLKFGLAQHDIDKVVSQAAEGHLEALSALLTRMADAARPPIIDGDAAPPPAIVLPIDQGEELFHSSGRTEGSAFLSLLAQLLRLDQPRFLALVTIRSDSYDLLQRARELEEIRHEAFSLPPLARGNYADVIRRPLEVLNRHLDNSGHNLKFDPAITERLTATLDEGAGRDALPLLAFTLARLYRDFHARGDITVADYNTMGGIGGSIDAAVDSALTRAAEDRRTNDGTARADMLRQTMIPRFAGIDPETGTARRRAARYDALPTEALPLVDALIAERLLTSDNGTVEPTHEALLREWKDLTKWLAEDREQLITLEGVRRAAADWQTNGQRKDYLAHREGRLVSAEGLVQRPDLWSGLENSDHAYLRACREAEDDENARRKADLDAREAAVKKGRRAVRIGGAVALALLLLAAGLGWFAWDRDGKAQKAEVDALALLALSRAETDPVRALKLILGAWPKTEHGPFPAPADALDAISTAITRTRPHVLLTGHESPVTSVAFSPDGRRIVSGSDDGTLRLWDAETGAPIGTPMAGHEDQVNSVAFSPDGRRIVSGGNGGSMRLQDAETGAPIGTPMAGHERSVTSVAFSPDGRRIVSGSYDRTLRLWDAETGAPIGTPMAGHESSVLIVAFSLDGRRIVSGSDDGTLRLWDAETGAPIGNPVAGHEPWIYSVAFSPDGRRIVSGSKDGTLRLQDAETGTPVGIPMAEHEGQVKSIAISPDGRRIVSSGYDGTLRLWDAETGAPIGTPVAGLESLVLIVAFSPDGRRIVSGSIDGTLRLWDAETGTPIGAPVSGQEDWVRSVAISPDGRRIVSSGYDSTLRLWDAETGAPIGTPMAGHEDQVNSVAFSPDGRRIVSGSEDGTLRLWDAETGAPIGTPMAEHRSPVFRVAFSPDGRRIVSSDDDGTLRLWDGETGALIGNPIADRGEVRSLAFSPDGRRIVSGSEDGTLRLWDVETGAPIGTPLRGHVGWVTRVAFSPDGRRIISGGRDSTLRLWDAETGAPFGTPMVEHGGEVTSVAFSSDGGRIVSGSVDSTLRLWDAETRRPFGTPMAGHEDWVISVAFSPDGSRILSGSGDGTLLFWEINYPNGNLLQIACRYLPVIDGRPDTSTDGLTAGIVNRELSLPTDCDSYDPPLPPEYRR